MDTVLRGRATDEVRARVASEVTSRVDELARDHTALDLDFLSEDVLEMPTRPKVSESAEGESARHDGLRDLAALLLNRPAT